MNLNIKKLIIKRPDQQTWFYVIPQSVGDQYSELSGSHIGFRSAEMALDYARDFYPHASIEMEVA